MNISGPKYTQVKQTNLYYRLASKKEIEEYVNIPD